MGNSANGGELGVMC